MSKDLTVLKAVIKANTKRHKRLFEQLEPGKPYMILGDSMAAYMPVDEKTFYNLGIPGDTTLGVLERLDQVIRLKPKIIFFNIGLNDFVLTTLTHEETLNNIIEIRRQLLEALPGVTIYQFSLTPINQRSFESELYVAHRKKTDITDMNRLLKETFHDLFLDVYYDLSDQDDELLEAYTKDGVHLNEIGYQFHLKQVLDHL